MNWMKTSRTALALAAIVAAATPAAAEPPKGHAPTKAAEHAEKAADKAEKHADKAADKAEKAEDRAEKKGTDKAEDKAEKAENRAEKAADHADDKAREAKHAARHAERVSRVKAEREELRTKIKAALKGRAFTPAMKEQLTRHARRIARLDRVKELAAAANDTEATARVDKLIARENARQEKWLSNAAAKTDDKAGAK